MASVKRTGIVLKPNSARVLFRPFIFTGENRYLKIIARVMSLSEREVAIEAKKVLAEFKGRHQRLERYLLRRFEEIKTYLLTDEELSASRRLVLGAYFT